MYTLTVKISSLGTLYNDPKDPHNSLTGHMWYSISDGTSTNSFGFAPINDGDPWGPGEVKINDDTRYAYQDYTGTIVITKFQYNKLIAFGQDINLNGNPFDFSTEYMGLTNSCIDYTWKALYYAGINPSHSFDGDVWPTDNSDDADMILYKYLMGSLDGWSSDGANASNYDVIYGSKDNDTLINIGGVEAIYGGEGNDVVIGNEWLDNLYGGKGNDILIGGNYKDYLNGGAGFDTYIAGSEDEIFDEDGKGVVYFKNIDLSGTKHKVKGKDYYEDDSFYYVDNGGILVISSKSGGSSMTITDWSNKDLGITLGDSIEVSITKEAFALEGDTSRRELYFTVTLSRALEDGESLKVSVSGTDEGYVIFESGEKSKRVTHSWDGDTRDEGSIAKGGYQALSYYDSNKDNIIDADDERMVA